MTTAEAPPERLVRIVTRSWEELIAMYEIRNADSATVSRLRKAALADFACVVRRFNDEPTLANFDLYRIACRRLDATNRLLATAERHAPNRPDRLDGVAA